MEVNGKRVPFLNEARNATEVALGKRHMGYANGGRAKPTTKLNYAQTKPAQPKGKSK